MSEFVLMCVSRATAPRSVIHNGKTLYYRYGYTSDGVFCAVYQG